MLFNNLSIPNDWSSREGDSSDSFVAERRYPPFNLKWNDYIAEYTAF